MIKFDDIIRQSHRAQEYFEDKVAFSVGPVELKNMMDERCLKIIDVRKPELYRKSHIPNAISMPAETLLNEIDTLSKKHVHVVYCYNQQCHLAAKCCLMLAADLIPVVELEGGFDAWQNFGFEIES